MRRFLIPLVACLAAAGSEPGLLELAPPDTGVLVGIDFERIKASRFGQSVLSQVKGGSPELAKFIEATGFDPLRDVREVLIAAPSTNQKARGLFLVRGTFDPARIAGLEGPDVTGTTYRGVRVLTKRRQEPVSIACLDRSLVIGGDPLSVQAAIAARGQERGVDEALASKAKELRAANDIWVVARVSLEDLAADAPPQLSGALQGNALKAIRQFSGGVRFGTELRVRMDLLTRSEQDASGMAAGLKMLAGLAASNSKGPGTNVLNRLVLRAEGNTVRIALAIPEAELEAVMRSSVQAALEQARRTRAAAAPPARRPDPGGIVIDSSPRDMGTVKLPR